MDLKHGIVEELASEAIRLGANALDIDYKDGYEEVYAMTGTTDFGSGFGIAMIPSSSPEAVSLRSELRGIARKRRSIPIGDGSYELRCRVFESFGEDAFRVEIRPAKARIGRKSASH